MTYILIIALVIGLTLALVVVRSSYLKLEDERDLMKSLTEENENILKRNRQRKIEKAEKATADFLKTNEMSID